MENKPYRRISIVFIVIGILSLILSIGNITPLSNTSMGNLSLLAFIGLTLILWGTMIYLIRPVSYVRSNLLEATSFSTYSTIDRIEKHMKMNSNVFYIPPYPMEVFVPEHLKGLKEMIIYIAANENIEIPIEEIAKGGFIVEEDQGFIIIPPGIGVADEIEKELNINFEKINIDDLCEILPRIIVENLFLAKKVILKNNENHVQTQITDSVYKELYYKNNIQSILYIGSPLVSAIACAISKSTGKTVTIKSSKMSTDNNTIDVSYLIREG